MEETEGRCSIGVPGLCCSGLATSAWSSSDLKKLALEPKWRLELRPKKHQGACKRGMPKNSFEAKHVATGEPLLNPLGGARPWLGRTGAAGEGGTAHPDDICGKAL